MDKERYLERLALKKEITRLREALDDIALGVYELGPLSKDNMICRALAALERNSRRD
jgi:hypothetical protein